MQADLQYCLFCIYNNQDLPSYLKQLLSLHERLKMHHGITPPSLYALFEATVKDFMLFIRNKIVDEIRANNIIQQKPLQRRYSLDDYFLIDREISKSYSQHGFNNELFLHCSRYMADSRYEKVKAELRHKIWREVRKNNEAITSLQSNHLQFQRIFDIIVRFYTRVREAVLGIEEIWVFLIESLF